MGLYGKVLSRGACALAVGCFIWGHAGGAAAAEVSADQIVNALAPAPATRGLTDPEARPMTDSARAFVRRLHHRTRSLTFEEGEQLSDVSKDWKKIDLEVYFEYNSARIAREAEPQLNQLAEALRSPRLRHATVVLAGYTDSKGSQSFNERLSERRAEAVKRYLVERLEISSENLATVGYGKRHLKNPDDPYGAENRRVQILNAPDSQSAAAR